MPFNQSHDLRGVPSSRAYRPYKAFEITLDRVVGEKVRADGACAVDLWCALANIEWHGPEQVRVAYSSRKAGDVVAWVREDGDYLTWYCSGEPGVVSDWIGQSLNKAGWSWRIYS